MIGVDRIGTNYFVLKGDSLFDGMSQSKVTIHDDGYHVYLKAKCPDLPNRYDRREIGPVKKEEVISAILTALTEMKVEEGVNQREVSDYLDQLEVFASEHMDVKVVRKFDYNIDEMFRRVPELAPVIPPEALERMAKRTPLVEEAAALIGNWYLFLSQMFYGEMKTRFATPQTLDEYLDRMEAWLTEVKGVSFQKLGRIDRTIKPNTPPETDTR